MARKRRVGRPRKAGAKRRRRRSAAVAVAPRRRRRRSIRSRARTMVRRARAGVSRVVRRRRRGRPRKGGSSFTTRGIVGQLKQAVIDGGFVVLGDVSANIAKILTGQTGLMGNVAQVGGGLAAGFVVSKYVGRDAGRMVLAGATAGIVKQLITDQLLPAIPAGTMKTNLTAALQGYPHADFAATMQGYLNAGDTAPNQMGLPSGSLYQGAY
jgi:hypothetical protein